jgi:hypothetical protein
LFKGGEVLEVVFLLEEFLESFGQKKTGLTGFPCLMSG